MAAYEKAALVGTLPAPSDSATGKWPPRLWEIHSTPSWCVKAHVMTSYRPIHPSVRACFASLLYLHNETVNIYTHLIPGLVTLVLACSDRWGIGAFIPTATPDDLFVLRVNLWCTTVCFLTSALYHTIHCHSYHHHCLWVRCDYAAILMQITGSFFSGIYVGFYCEPGMQRIHSGVVSRV